MSGFSVDWLALREPADARARSVHLARVLTDRLRGRSRRRRLRIVDLGCGSGSSLRWLAPRLPAAQAWTLVDADPDLLRRARHAARSAQVPATTRRLDLARADLGLLLQGADLVTASALLDLVSAAWLRRLVRACARERVPLWATLSYDGRTAIDPADPLDATVQALFDRHQRRDKGFGRALGPTAAATAAGLARARGARVRVRRSDWRLGTSEAALIAELLRGWAAAAIEVEPAAGAAIEAWIGRRLRAVARGGLRVVVGHRDLLVHWPEPALSRPPPGRSRAGRPSPADAPPSGT